MTVTFQIRPLDVINGSAYGAARPTSLGTVTMREPADGLSPVELE
jgi:hypothetical protein